MADDASLPDFASDHVIDARGHRCPTPTLRLRRALELRSAGDVVLLLADDPLARIDVPHFVNQIGCELLGLEMHERELRFRVRKV
jgi:tRNA 2-thiouridine synthesizing protein A